MSRCRLDSPSDTSPLGPTYFKVVDLLRRTRPPTGEVLKHAVGGGEVDQRPSAGEAKPPCQRS